MSAVVDERTWDGIRALIGRETPRIVAPHPVESSEVRRFKQSTMDEVLDGLPGWDPAEVPLGFPVHMFRRRPDEADPLSSTDDPNFDGQQRDFCGLPELRTPFKRLLNGGYQYRFLKRARIGDVVSRVSSYKDLMLKNGRSGQMLFVAIESTYFNADDEVLLVSTNTLILR